MKNEVDLYISTFLIILSEGDYYKTTTEIGTYNYDWSTFGGVFWLSLTCFGRKPVCYFSVFWVLFDQHNFHLLNLF